MKIPPKSFESKPKTTSEGQETLEHVSELNDVNVFVKKERRDVCPVEDQWQVISETNIN